VLFNVLATLGSAAACDSQVGENYTGEPLLSIHGTVQNGAVDPDLVPALGFETLDGMYLVDGHMTGTFPAQFQFDVTEVPPDAAFTLLPTADVALGTLLMVPRNHPQAYLETHYNDSAEDSYPMITTCSLQGNINNCSTVRDPTSNTMTEQRTTCDSNGNCLYRTYNCTVEACESLASYGDSALRAPQGTIGVSGNGDVYCYDNQYCATDQVEFDNNDINHSYREIEYCDMGNLVSSANPGWVSTDGTITRCILTNQTGDTSLSSDYKSIVKTSRNLIVAYARHDRPDWVPPMVRGYNLIESTTPTTDQVLAEVICKLDAVVTAYKEYNAANGTSYVPYSPTVSQAAEQSTNSRSTELANQCSKAEQYRRIPDPSAESLTIQVGNLPAQR